MGIKSIAGIIQTMQQNLPVSLQEDFKKSNNELSVYGSGQVSSPCLADNTVKLKKAFPKLSPGWFDVLESSLDSEGFTDQRLTDAAMTLIRTCEYPEPTIARILSYDRTIKVFTFNELLSIANDYSPSSRAEYLNQFDRINFYGELRFAKKEDIKKYNLPKFNQ